MWCVKMQWHKIPLKEIQWDREGPKRRAYAVERIPPNRKVKQEVEAVLQGWETKGHPLDMLVRLGARHILGRAYYQRGARNRQRWRNG